MDLTNKKSLTEVAKFIINADENTSLTNWKNIVRNFGNDLAIQELLINSPHIPDECIEQLIYEKKLRSQLCLLALKKDYLSEPTVKLSISSSVAFYELKNFLLHTHQTGEKIPDQNLIWLYSLPHDDIKYLCLKNISDETFIKGEMDNGIDEHYMTAVADNKFLNPTLRMEAFESGVDYMKIDAPLPEMADDICSSLMGTVFDKVIDKNNANEELIRTVCIEKLNKLVKSNVCSGKMQLELLNKCEEHCKENPEGCIIDLYTTLVQNTKDENVLAYGCDSEIQNIKHFSICNSSLNKGLSAAIADTVLMKIKEKSGLDYTSDMAMVSMLMKRTKLTYWAYDNIMRNNYTSLLEDMASSPNTPMSYLKELQKHRNQKVARMAEFTEKAFHSSLLYKDEFKKALNAFNVNAVLDSDNVLVLRLPQALEKVSKLLTDIAESTTAVTLKDSITQYITEMQKESEYEMAKKYCGLCEFNKDSQEMTTDYKKIPFMAEEFLKECLGKMNTNHLERFKKEIEYDYFVANTPKQYIMFEGKETINKIIDEIIQERNNTKDIKEKEVRDDGIEI